MVHRSGWESLIPYGNPAELVEGPSLLEGPVASYEQPSTRCWHHFQEGPVQGPREPLRISPQKNLQCNGNSTRTHGEGRTG